MADQPRPPHLWEAMDAAYMEQLVSDDEMYSHEEHALGMAAEILVVRDRLTPAEPPLVMPEHPSPLEIAMWARREERQRLRTELEAEAKLAQEAADE